jgi:hypothetical protein
MNDIRWNEKSVWGSYRWVMMGIFATKYGRDTRGISGKPIEMRKYGKFSLRAFFVWLGWQILGIFLW